MKLCNVCNNILTKSTDNDILKFSCQTCFTEILASDDDTLMAENIIDDLKSTNSIFYKSEIYLNIAKFDPISTLVNKQCINCKENILKRIILGVNKQCIFVCPSCNIKFVK